MPEVLCLDASVVLKLYLPEEDAEEAKRLVRRALMQSEDLLVPPFFLAEMVSTLRKAVHRGRMPREEANEGFTLLMMTPLEEIGGPEVYRRAWEIAEELGMPTIYDSVYLAVAELRGAEFWTADRKLFEKAKGRGFVHLLGE